MIKSIHKPTIVLFSLLLIITGTVATADLDIFFLDVGEGDAAIVVCDDNVMLIDGGNPSDSSLVYTYLKDTLGIETINYIIATHPHTDHIGGIPGALNACKVEKFYSPVTKYDSSAFEAVKKYLDIQGKTIELPPVRTAFFLGKCRVRIIGPQRFNYTDMNDMSIVVKVIYGNTSFLFMGDAGIPAEMDILETGYDLKADVLKVGHHGSITSTGSVFLEAVSPTYSIISVGADNTYGHPSPEVLDLLKDTTIYRTDELGHIICHSDGKELTFSFEHR